MNSARWAVWLRNNGWVFNLIFIALGSYFVAGAASAVMARSIRQIPSQIPSAEELPVALGGGGGRMQLGRPKGFSMIAERNLLGLKRESLHADAPASEAGSTRVSGRHFKESELQPCTMASSLRATLVAQEGPEGSLAVLFNHATRDTGIYSIHDGSNLIADDAVLVEVRSREIVIRRRDHFERCLGEGEGGMVQITSPPAMANTMGPSGGASGADAFAGVTQLSETDYRVERSEVDRVLNNLNEVATQVRFVPYFKNGKANGFKAFAIRPNSIFSKIGLQNGDVVQRINGYEMNSPDRALEIYTKLKDAVSLSIEIERNNQVVTLHYKIRS